MRIPRTTRFVAAKGAGRYDAPAAFVGAWCRGRFSSPTSIWVNFVEGRSLAVQAMALDHRTMLGPQLRIQRPRPYADTLQPCRKNLLRIDYQSAALN